MTRYPALDMLRGFLLLLMTLTHLPTVWAHSVDQPVGFISAAEGFVFLSAFLGGTLHARLRRKSGLHAADAWAYGRAAQLYLIHLVLLVLAFTVVAWIAETFERPAAYNLLSFYFQHPSKAVVGAATLVYQPPLLDILPLYVLCLLATPLVLHRAARHGWGTVLALSMTLWLLAQFGLRRGAYALLESQFGWDIPVGEMGSFDLYAWQFLWVLGLWFGSLVATRGWREHLPTGRFLNLALIVCVGMFAWRHVVGVAGFHDLAWHLFWIDKWTLSPVRVLNLAALVYLLAALGPALGRLRLPPLEFLGRASLWVFVTHIGTVLFMVCLIGSDDRPLSGPAGVAVLVTGFCILFLAAALHRHRHRSAAPSADAPVQADAIKDAARDAA